MIGLRPKIRLLRLNDVRRRLKLPPVRAYESSFREALAHTAETGAIPRLTRVEVADLRDEVRTLIPPAFNALRNHPVIDDFRGTDSNMVTYAGGRQAQLDLYRYRDVLFVSNGQCFTIWRGRAMDENSTGTFLAKW